jgi:hypothetical protein
VGLHKETMREKVKEYDWQCLQCKICEVCGAEGEDVSVSVSLAEICGRVDM